MNEHEAALLTAALAYGQASTAVMDEIDRLYAGGREITDGDRNALVNFIPRARSREKHTREMLEVMAKAYAKSVAGKGEGGG